MSKLGCGRMRKSSDLVNVIHWGQSDKILQKFDTRENPIRLPSCYQ